MLGPLSSTSVKTRTTAPRETRTLSRVEEPSAVTERALRSLRTGELVARVERVSIVGFVGGRVLHRDGETAATYVGRPSTLEGRLVIVPLTIETALDPEARGDEGGLEPRLHPELREDLRDV